MVWALLIIQLRQSRTLTKLREPQQDNKPKSHTYEPGDYYVWGCTVPTTYDLKSMSYFPVSYNFTEENISGSNYDAATAVLGKNWRMPTYKDAHDGLLNNTTCSVIYAYSTIIYDFKSNINDEHLYIPASAYRHYLVKDNGSLYIYDQISIEDEELRDTPFFWLGDGNRGDDRECVKGDKITLAKKYRGMPIRPVYDETN